MCGFLIRWLTSRPRLTAVVSITFDMVPSHGEPFANHAVARARAREPSVVRPKLIVELYVPAHSIFGRSPRRPNGAHPEQVDSAS